MRNLGGAVGIAICGAILNIASTLTPTNAPLRNLMTATTRHLATLLGSPHAASEAALRELWNLAYREASTMAYADAFRVLMLACLVAAGLVPLMRKVAPAPVSRASGTH